MRLIDADKVIKTLREHKKLFCRNQIEFRMLPPDQKARVDEIDACISELINAEPMDTEPPWIPCSERLPETTDAVLTTYIVNGDRSRRYVEESSYYWTDESWSSPWDEYREIGTSIEDIAWMPLPEPYQDGGQDENR